MEVSVAPTGLSVQWDTPERDLRARCPEISSAVHVALVVHRPRLSPDPPGQSGSWTEVLSQAISRSLPSSV
jgi:hypothetical protein